MEMVRSAKKTELSRLADHVMGVLFFLPFLDFSGLNYLINNKLEYVTLIVSIILLFILIFKIRKVRKSYLIVGLFYLIILLSTFINGRELLPAFYYAAKNICFMILIDYFSRKKKLIPFLTDIKNVMCIVIIINLLFQLFDQDFFGYTPSNNFNNFLVSDNFLGYMYIPFIMLVYCTTFKKEKVVFMFQMIFWSAICLISLIKAWAATCMAIFVLFLAIMLLDTNKILKYIYPFRAFMINVCISIMVIFLHIQDYFEWLIVDILHKSLTLSGRIYVWASAVSNIKDKPWLGYGTVKGGRLSINYSDVLQRAYFSHNVFLEVLIQGGIIAMICLVITYFFAEKELKMYPDCPVNSVICLSIFSILLMQFSEFALYMPFVNLPLILCFFYKELNEELSCQ